MIRIEDIDGDISNDPTDVNVDTDEDSVGEDVGG